MFFYQKEFINLDQKYLNIYRLIVCIFGWTTLILLVVVPFELNISGRLYSLYTFQANILVLSWFTITLIFYKKDKKPKLLNSGVDGAVTLYNVVALLIYVTGLAPRDSISPEGIQFFTNLSNHIIIPIIVFIDWLLPSFKYKYKWSYILYWSIYPIGYLAYCLILAGVFQIYIYEFFNLSKIAIGGIVISILGLISVFIILELILIFINRKLYNKFQ